MNISIQIGKATSSGVPGKNLKKIFGRHLLEYSLLAAANSKKIDKMFFSTESAEIAEIASGYGAHHINRIGDVESPETLTEDVLVHALNTVRESYGIEPKIVAIFFSNAPTVLPERIDSAIDILESNEDIDSVFSICEYNMFSPLRAKKLSDEGFIAPYMDLSQLGNISNANRDSLEACYFADFTVQVVRPHCIDHIWAGSPPIRWMGNKCYGLLDGFGFDVDDEWQWPVIEHWLDEKGFS